jgi:hypothetical protein
MKGAPDDTETVEEERLRKVKAYKRKFDSSLRHIKLILTNYRKSLSLKEWHNLVNDTKNSVMKYPHDYLGPKLPDKNITRLAIIEVFEGFLKDQHVREVQRFRDQD